MKHYNKQAENITFLTYTFSNMQSFILILWLSEYSLSESAGSALILILSRPACLWMVGTRE